MLKFSVSHEVETFRKEFREWLAHNPLPSTACDSSLESFVKVGKSWQKTLASGRWVGVHWPSEFGGRSLSLVHEAIVQEELVRAGSPQLLGLFGLSMAGPILIEYGTIEQKRRFLPNILSADEVWCQGFSETQAGSDLSALKTTATFVDSPARGYVIQGSKVWTSFAHVAQWCFLLCKSERVQEKYKSFSYLLVPMDAPGISLRPLQQITGDSEFNEVFFDNVFVPEANRVGAPGEGWKIAISTLMYERVILTFARQLQSEVLLRALLKESHPEYRRELALEVSRLCAVRALAYEHLTRYRKEKPGPEGSLDKLLWTDTYQALVKLALELHPEDAVLSEERSPHTHRYLYSRGRSIAAGTSEIQRNIIAERILGMPRLRSSAE